MSDKVDAHGKFLKMFDQFFTSSSMSSTYKPVFLRSLLDIGDYGDPVRGKKLVGKKWLERKDGRLLVDLNFIASRFALDYWYMEHKFRLRHSNDRNDAAIVRIIRNYEGIEPPTLEYLDGDEKSEFRKQVISESIKPEVLKHILTDMKDLFVSKPRIPTISFDENIVTFLRANRKIIDKGLIGVIVSKLEKLNRRTPQISQKIEFPGMARGSLSKEKRLVLNDIQDSRCFYCEGSLDRMYTDYIVPYEFILSTDMYNCTIACRKCSRGKSNLLPERRFFNNALERNREMEDYLKKLSKPYDEGSYVRLFDDCAAEYNGDIFFSPSALRN